MTICNDCHDTGFFGVGLPGAKVEKCPSCSPAETEKVEKNLARLFGPNGEKLIEAMSPTIPQPKEETPEPTKNWEESFDERFPAIEAFDGMGGGNHEDTALMIKSFIRSLKTEWERAAEIRAWNGAHEAVAKEVRETGCNDHQAYRWGCADCHSARLEAGRFLSSINHKMSELRK